MAKGQSTPFRNTFAGGAKAHKEMHSNLERDRVERLASNIILNPEEVGGDYDFKRALMTTLGGKARMITLEDLKTFSAYTRQLGQKYKGGITAKNVIDLSDVLVSYNQKMSDRDRAAKEIFSSIPTVSRAGRVQFQTNSGPTSGVSRHYVIVEFMDYSAALNADVPPQKAAQLMCKGNIKLECDCERWRYFFRYGATVGRFNAGRPETGFPKITNSGLKGVACKHVVRTCSMILQSTTFKNYAANMVDRGRKTLDNKKITAKSVEMKSYKELASKEMSKKWNMRRITTTDEKRLLRQAKAKVPKALQPVVAGAQKKAQQRLNERAKKISLSSNQEAAIRRQMADTRSNLEAMGLPQDVVDQMLKTGEAALRKAVKGDD